MPHVRIHLDGIILDKPQDLIHQMGAQVQQGTASHFRFGKPAAKGPRPYARGDRLHLPDDSRLHQIVHLLLGNEEAQRIARHVADARLCCRLLDPGRLSLVHGDRFLRQDVLPFANSSQRDLVQHVVRRGNDDRIDLAVVEQLIRRSIDIYVSRKSCHPSRCILDRIGTSG